jgi:hypothetical protein
VPLCPPQIPRGLTWDRTRVSAVGGRRLTAWAMARPLPMYACCPLSSRGSVVGIVQWFLTIFMSWAPLRAGCNLRTPSQKKYLNAQSNLRSADRVDCYHLHVFGEKGTSRNHMYPSLPFLGYNNLIVRFVEVNKQFWGLEAINYSVA